MTPGEKIKQLREEKGWSVYRLSELSKVKGSVIKDIEAEESNYTIGTLIKLCAVLEVEIDLKPR